ncbi:lipoamide acyltransferase component of branched-chain alpha-keto acid dehydrogenase complex, mitochondrial [Hyposmocoma kahamanoa]|uniref:lipoamide acyltransferase component of branched-chain alpha-keto acid dehydrogenase complex, mitochondrial n=1 Tax=Hyposmocoma kahamanoa TaxID=1477025 RepID=UPI000E6D68B6|nr:lipoamide acyltransferase component of branched-chain alpha-keto acid dehydrogenase complex, mitochondrial [Hyposmocoma kahamanoa]
MAFLMRRCVLNVWNIKKCRKLSLLTQIDRLKKDKPSRLEKHFHPSGFHTSRIANKTVAFKLSDIGEGIREVVIKEWFVKVGDKVQQFDNICEVQSDKAAVTITSRYDGVVSKLYHEVDQTALVGRPLIDIEVDEEDTGPTDPEKVKAEVPKVDKAVSQKIKVLTTPSVRRIAAQYKVDFSKVKASGRNGRILKEDILGYLNISADVSNEIPDPTTIQAVSIPVTQARVTTEILLEDRVVPITGFVKAMVKTMTEAMKIPHFVFSDEYDVTKLVESREVLKNMAQERGVKLTYMPIIIKATSLSLAAYPIINSSLDSSCENIIYKASHNIGVAMDTPNGLVVPVIKNVQSKSILQIARELNNLQEKGAKGQLGLSELTGGTFTISNIGIVGGTYTKPVIFPPQVSIGALGKIQMLPRFDIAGNVVKRHILTVSWSADHRVIDGVTMARFSNQLKAYLENPYTLLLDI